MPAFSDPRQLVGATNLPALIQELLQRMPVDQVPAPASMIYRGPGDIAQVLGARAQAPTVPAGIGSAMSDYAAKVRQLLPGAAPTNATIPAGGSAPAAFDDYLQKIAQLLSIPGKGK